VSLYRDHAVVLRTMRLGEADRIVTLATEEHGKVRAVVKGVRRTSSRFGGRLEPAAHVALQLWHGRGELDTVTQADVRSGFLRLRADLSRLSKAYTLLEVADAVFQERHPAPRLYQMLVGALSVLDAEDPPLLVAAYVLKVLAADGAAPELGVCVACGSAGPLVAYDPTEGGVLCGACRRGRPLSPGALELLRAILGGGLRAALGTPASAVADEVSALATEAIEAHLDRRLRSLHAGALR
jgi:DNA repair protein RecO (recombination protein O)